MKAATEYSPDGMLILDKPVKLPEVLEMLIVGGGPAGTAAAFRAKELGISALVIEIDDLLKQFRDYGKKKPIKPDYIPNDPLKFPKGGRLLSLLKFTETTNDIMWPQWKGYYREHNVPAQVGIELINLQRRDDGVWQATAYNRNTRAEKKYLAKHVVLALGAGSPRPLDIPGNTKDIAFRLSDPARYIGAPALVIGGGTSATEAVIAVSNAKNESEDASAVYWSYRGGKMPTVPIALAGEFFEAYVHNGNIRHYPYSDAVEVVAVEDGKEYLSIRTDRRIIPGRPNETSHLEFPKDRCIVCIGQEIPEEFLNKLGIELAAGGASNKKLIVVSPLLESQQSNVYLIGGALGKKHFETEDFDADPSTFKVKKDWGNIKAALIDGVFVAEVIKQKLDGKTHIRIEMDFVDDGEAEAEKPSSASREQQVYKSLTQISVRSDPATAPPIKKQEARLIKILSGEIEEEEFSVKQNGVTTIGAFGCDINFDEDPLLAGQQQHASIVHSPEGYLLRDDASAIGVFWKLKKRQPLEVFPGNIVRLSQQFLLFRAAGAYSFTHYDMNGIPLKSYKITGKMMVLGRQSPDVTLDSSDKNLSRRHLSIALQDNRIMLEDLDSVNGSFLKLRNAVRLQSGDEFKIGQQLLRFTVKEAESRRSVNFLTSPPVPVSASKPSAPSSAPAKVGGGDAVQLEGMQVMFKNVGKTFEFKKGKSICEIAEINKVPIVASCHVGDCGSDPVRIIFGSENLSDLSDKEQERLDELLQESPNLKKLNLKPGECRLACMAKPRGPVVVEILKP
jgi:thioredoxin reductase/ferredoxin